MGIYGIGTDVVELARIEASLQRHPERFPARILARDELRDFKALNGQQVAFLAKRFASKEAASKALGCGFRDGLRFADFEVIHDKLGKPMLRFHGRAAELVAELGIVRSHLSIADERASAVAFVVLEQNQ